MRAFHRVYIALVSLALVACNNSISAVGEGDENPIGKDPKKQTQELKSLIETVEGLSIQDFNSDEKLVIRILCDTGDYDTFLMDLNAQVEECSDDFCSSIRSPSEAKYSSEVDMGPVSDTLTLTAKAGAHQGESLRIRLFSLDNGSYLQAGTYIAQSNEDNHVKELGEHYTNRWGSTSWSMEFAYIEGTNYAAAILEDNRKWNDPMKPADAYESSSQLTIGSNTKVRSLSILSSFKEGSGIADGSVIGSAKGEVLFTLGDSPDIIEKVQITYFGAAPYSSMRVVYEAK